MVIGHVCDGPVSVLIHDAGEPQGTVDVAADLGQGDILGAFQEATEVEEGEAAGIPVFGDGITLHERKDGPLAVSRRAELDFPIEALGESWIEYIDAYQEGGGIQKCSITMRPDNQEALGIEENELYDLEETVMVGYVGAVGSNGANTGHLTIFGPYNLLSSIPVGAHIHTITDEYGSIRGIMDYIRDRFIEGQQVFDGDDVELNILGLDQTEDIDIPATAPDKTFSGNRDTLANVVDYMYDGFGFDMWFEPLDTGKVQIVAEALPDSEIPLSDLILDEFKENVSNTVQQVLEARGQLTTTYDSTDDGLLEIINNNALYEMKPFNAITLKGGTDLIETDNTYPEATAWYPPLVDRADGRIITQGESDKSSPEGVKQEARARLKDSLDGVSGGTMDLALSPFVRPYDKIIAQPTCNGRTSIDLPELVYEVQRTAHKIQPNETGNNVYTTEVSVSMAIDPSLIEASATSKDIQPSKESDNRPQETAPWVDIDFSTVQ